MNSKEVIQLLRHQRHDMMNHLQVMQGYLSMGKTEKVHTKMEEVNLLMANERKLMNLEIDEFALWVIQFNSINKNIRLTYDIRIEGQNLNLYESFMLKNCQHIAELVESYGDHDELYEANLIISNGNEEEEVRLEFSISGSFLHLDKLIEKLNEQEGIDTRVLEDGIVCEILINTTR